jgi:hypothetical protein
VILIRETEEREAREREQQRLEGERIAEQERFEEEMQFSLQRRDNMRAQERQSAQARADEEAAEAALERSEEIRKAEEKMRKAFAAMASEKGGVAVSVPTTLSPGLPGLPPAGGRSGQRSQGPKPQEVGVLPARQNTLRSRPSIKGGLPSGPRGGGAPPPIRRNQSVDQRLLGGSRDPVSLKQPFRPEEVGIGLKKQNTIGPRPSIRGGLPSAPKGGGGPLPIRKEPSVGQRPAGESRVIGLPGRPRGGGLPENRNPLIT